MQTVDILQDVGLPIRDEKKEKFVQGLVDVSHIVRLDRCMLSGGVGQFGKRGKKAFNSRAGYGAKVSGEDSFAAASAN